MGSTIYRPGHAKADSITVQADHDGDSWVLTVIRRAPTEHLGHVSQRMRYTGLSDSEMVDVIDVELHQALGLI
jgi:hypothetical protein